MRKIRHSSFGASTDAQALVIGVVLLIAIVATATALYLSINGPVETKKCEFQHSNEVTVGFTALNSAINSLLRTESSVASVSVPIKMTPTKESRIALPLSSGSISFSPNEENITVKVDESGTGTSGTWVISNFTNNFSIDYGNVKVEEGNLTLAPHYSFARIVSDMSNVYGSIGNDTGSNNTCYGTISWNATIPANTEIEMHVRTSINGDMSNSTGWVEVKNGQNLVSILPTLNGHRYIQFRTTFITYDPSERPALIDVRINYYSPFDDCILADSSGSISFKSSYHYLPNLILTYENGAVIKNQDAGEFVFRPFNFSFSNASGVPRINISLVNLTGTEVTHSGAPASLVRLNFIEHKLISDSFFYPNLTINISSKYPVACGNWFNKTLEKTTLTTPQDYNVSVDDTAKTVVVELKGDGVHGVQLYLEKTTVEVEI